MDLNKTLAEIASLVPPGVEAYVVGGTVRDLLLGRVTSDIDLAVSGDAAGFAAMVADAIGGTSFALDEGRGVFRAARSGLPYHVDVSRLRGTIAEDLSLRDFTINAMAAPLSVDGRVVLIDSLGGEADLASRLIRVVSPAAFLDDPLRLLRAFRFSCQLGFAVYDETMGLVRAARALINGVSAERVRDELYIILGQEGCADAFRAMYAAGLLQEVIPELARMEGVPQSAPHEHDVLEHSFRAMSQASVVMAGLDGYFNGHAAEVAAYLGTQADGLLLMDGLVRLCALLHDTGKPGTCTVEPGRIRFTGHDVAGEGINGAISARLRFSARAARVLGLVTRAHLRPLHLTKEPATRRAIHRYAREMGEDLPASLIVALADAFATRERQGAVATDVEGLVLDVVRYYYGEFSAAKASPLITGDDLVEALGLVPGPLFGVILDDVDERRAEGAVADKEGALRYVRGKYAGGLLPG